jgi:hypothetical protein
MPSAVVVNFIDFSPEWRRFEREYARERLVVRGEHAKLYAICGLNPH